MSQTLKKEVWDIVRSKFDILDIIDLIDFDDNLDLLATKIGKLQNAELAPNQRIVVLHHDTDFYPTVNHSEIIGNTIFNLFKLINVFNVPSEKIIFFTNHYGIKEEVDRVSQVLFNLPTSTVVYTSQWYDFPDEPTIMEQIENQPKVSDISALYCCLNGVRRMHRVLMLCYLQKTALLSKGIVSYHFNS
jgi:hypothetical protein